MPATEPTIPTPKKRKSRRTTYVLLAVTAALLVAAAIAARKWRRDPPVPVTTDRAAIRTITHVVTATGKVQPETEVRISPEVAGELIRIAVDEGDTVRKGDLLVRIKPDFYQAQVEQQEAALASAKAASVLSAARLAKAGQDFKQAQELYQKKLISDADFLAAKTNLDVAKADFDSSEAQVRRTEGSLSQAKDSLEKTTIYSPMDGTISSLTSEEGERVVGTGQFAGTEIMRIADLDHMEVRVKVNENDIVSVKPGDCAVVSVDAFPARRFEGKVREISSSALTAGATGTTTQSALAASASDEVTNFLVRISITEREVKLRPGMSATVDIETQTAAGVVTVPIQSVTVRAEGGMSAEELQKSQKEEAKQRSGNDLDVVSERDEARRNRERLPRVVFIKQGDRVRQRQVETGIADNTYIAITKGVAAGEEVVSGTYAAISRKLKDGSRVTIEEPKTRDRGW